MKHLIVLFLILIALSSPGNILADSTAVSAGNYTLYKSTTEINDILKEKKQITSAQVEQILSGNIEIEPKTTKLNKNTWVTTGSSGTAKAEIAQGTYKLHVEPVKDYNLTFPEKITLGGKAAIVSIGITPGSGTIKKTGNGFLAKITGFFNNDVYAQDAAANVTVVTYHDENKNSRWDRGENIVPWAGVTVQFLNGSQTPKSDSQPTSIDNVPFFKMQLGPEN